MLIVVEGIAGSGKTTLINELISRPEFKMFTKYRFPNREDPFPLVKGSDEGDWFLPAALATAQMFKEFPAGGSRQNCLVDRYCYSTMAYQMVMGMPSDIAETLPGNLQTPDIVIYIGTHPKIAMKRIAGRIKQKDAFEEESFLNKVYMRYASVIVQQPTNNIWLDGLTSTKIMADIVIEEVFNGCSTICDCDCTKEDTCKCT